MTLDRCRWDGVRGWQELEGRTVAGWVPLGQSRAGTALGTFHRKECGGWAARTSQGSHCDAPPSPAKLGIGPRSGGGGADRRLVARA